MEFCLLLGYLKLENKKFALTPSSQNTVIKVAMSSSYMEYGIMAVVIFVTVRNLILEAKRAKTDSKFKKYLDMKNQFLIFKPRVFSGNIPEVPALGIDFPNSPPSEVHPIPENDANLPIGEHDVKKKLMRGKKLTKGKKKELEEKIENKGEFMNFDADAPGLENPSPKKIPKKKKR